MSQSNQVTSVCFGDIEIKPDHPDYEEVKKLQEASATPEEFSLKLRIAGWRYRKPGLIEKVCCKLGLSLGETVRKSRKDKSNRLNFFGRHLKSYTAHNLAA